MPASVEQLAAKARAAVEVLNQMTAKQREGHPSPSFMDDYNNFRRLVLEARKDLADVAPPKVDSQEAFGGAECKFVELLVYYKQFVELLKK